MACTKGHRNNKTKKTRFIKKGDYIMDIIKSIEHEQMKSKIPYLKVGDTVKRGETVVLKVGSTGYSTRATCSF